MSMIKYRQVIERNNIFELTSSKENKKTAAEKKIKYLDMKFLPKNIKKFIISIIQKISFFDALVLLVILLVLGIFSYNRLQRKSEWVDIRISVENVDWWYKGSFPYYWYAANLKEGDIAYDSFGQKSAEVIKVDNYDLGGPYRNIYVDLKIRGVFNKKKQQYLYEFKPLVIGSGIAFNFSNQQVKGLIVKIGEKEISYFYKTIKIRVKEVIPELADKINIGDKSFDTNGDLVNEIIDLKKSINSFYEFSDIRGKNIKVYDSDFRDLEITLKVKTFSDLDRNFYINQAVIKIGSFIWFQFPDYALEEAEIIEIIE